MTTEIDTREQDYTCEACGEAFNAFELVGSTIHKIVDVEHGPEGRHRGTMDFKETGHDQLLQA